MLVTIILNYGERDIKFPNLEFNIIDFINGDLASEYSG